MIARSRFCRQAGRSSLGAGLSAHGGKPAGFEASERIAESRARKDARERLPQAIEERLQTGAGIARPQIKCSRHVDASVCFSGLAWPCCASSCAYGRDGAYDQAATPRLRGRCGPRKSSVFAEHRVEQGGAQSVGVVLLVVVLVASPKKDHRAWSLAVFLFF